MRNQTKANSITLIIIFIEQTQSIILENTNLCKEHNDSVRTSVLYIISGDPYSVLAAWADIGATCSYNAGKTTTYTLSYIDNPLGTADAVRVVINAPDGMLYMLPYNSTSTIELDTATDSTTVITGSQSQLASAPKIYGACYVNNAIYCMSENKAIYKFDLSDKTYSQIATVSNKYNGLCYDGVTYIYSLSIDTSGRILRFNVLTNTAEELSGLTGDNNKYQRLQLHPNGKLYASPQYYSRIIELDPSDIQHPVYFNNYTVQRSIYSCLTADGGLAIAPWEGSGTKKFAYANVTTKSVTFEPNDYISSGGWGWTSNIVLPPTGKPLALPQSMPYITEYDVVNNQFTIVGTAPYSANNSGAYYYQSGILAANNSVYCCPGSTANVKILKISISIADGRNFKGSTILSPLMNKY